LKNNPALPFGVGLWCLFTPAVISSGAIHFISHISPYFLTAEIALMTTSSKQQGSYEHASRGLSPPSTLSNSEGRQPSMTFVRRSNTRLTTQRLKIVDIIQAALDILNDDEERDLVTQESALVEPSSDESSQESSPAHS
jgi:hypothetical protein